jgi:alpha-mannosidase
VEKNMTQETRIHMIGNAHLDPEWLWQWQEGYTEIKATFRSTLDRMKEYPDEIMN